MNVYFISGMGLDERLFFRIKIKNATVQYIKWLEPIDEEDFGVYIDRLLPQITHQQDIMLVGVSMGGIAAIEIAKRIEVKQVVIISSVKTHLEKPAFFKVIKHVPLYKLSTPKMRKAFRNIWGQFFGLKSNGSMAFFTDMFESMSEHYKDWAVRQIANWKNTSYPKNLIHIHGDKDLIFPIRLIKNAEVISKGNHGMIATRASSISKRLNEIIDSYNKN